MEYKTYAVAMTALNLPQLVNNSIRNLLGDDPQIACGVTFILAKDEGEAKQQGMAFCRRNFPEGGGWTKHKVAVGDIACATLQQEEG